eukprot:Rmarinus@m.20959
MRATLQKSSSSTSTSRRPRAPLSCRTALKRLPPLAIPRTMFSAVPCELCRLHPSADGRLAISFRVSFARCMDLTYSHFLKSHPGSCRQGRACLLGTVFSAPSLLCLSASGVRISVLWMTVPLVGSRLPSVAANSGCPSFTLFIVLTTVVVAALSLFFSLSKGGCCGYLSL